MSDPITIPRGEKAFISAEFSGRLASGDSLASGATVAAYRRRGKVDVSAGQAGALIATTPAAPAAPAISGTTVTFWTVTVPEDYRTGNYDVEVSATTTNGEVVELYPPLTIIIV